MGGIPHLIPTPAAQPQQNAQATEEKAEELSPMAFAAAESVRLGGLLNAAKSMQQKMQVLTTPNLMGLMPIHLASALGQYRLIQFMLQQISDPAQQLRYLSMPDNNALPPLYWAASSPIDPPCLVNKTINQLLNAAPDEKAKTRLLFQQAANGRMPIHAAAQWGKPDRMATLLGHLNNPQAKAIYLNSKDFKQRTPLHWAILSNENKDRVATVKTILNQAETEKSRINLLTAKSGDGQTPIQMATQFEELECIEAMLDSLETLGEQLDYLTQIADSPHYMDLVLAQLKKNNRRELQTVLEQLQNAKTLARKVELLGIKDHHGFDPLQKALATGELDYIQALLDQLDDPAEKMRYVSKPDSRDCAPIDRALTSVLNHNKVDSVRLLLQAAGSQQNQSVLLDTPNKFGKTPLQLALQHLGVDFVKELINPLTVCEQKSTSTSM